MVGPGASWSWSTAAWSWSWGPWSSWSWGPWSSIDGGLVVVVFGTVVVGLGLEPPWSSHNFRSNQIRHRNRQSCLRHRSLSHSRFRLLRSRHRHRCRNRSHRNLSQSLRPCLPGHQSSHHRRWHSLRRHCRHWTSTSDPGHHWTRHWRRSADHRWVSSSTPPDWCPAAQHPRGSLPRSTPSCR
jgi:hypothetical protein